MSYRAPSLARSLWKMVGRHQSIRSGADDDDVFVLRGRGKLELVTVPELVRGSPDDVSAIGADRGLPLG